jgi:hypothetical protein
VKSHGLQWYVGQWNVGLLFKLFCSNSAAGMTFLMNLVYYNHFEIMHPGIIMHCMAYNVTYCMAYHVLMYYMSYKFCFCLKNPLSTGQYFTYISRILTLWMPHWEIEYLHHPTLLFCGDLRQWVLLGLKMNDRVKGSCLKPRWPQLIGCWGHFALHGVFLLLTRRE